MLKLHQKPSAAPVLSVKTCTVVFWLCVVSSQSHSGLNIERRVVEPTAPPFKKELSTADTPLPDDAGASADAPADAGHVSSNTASAVAIQPTAEGETASKSLPEDTDAGGVTHELSGTESEGSALDWEVNETAVSDESAGSGENLAREDYEDTLIDTENTASLASGQASYGETQTLESAKPADESDLLAPRENLDWESNEETLTDARETDLSTLQEGAGVTGELSSFEENAVNENAIEAEAAAQTELSPEPTSSSESIFEDPDVPEVIIIDEDGQGFAAGANTAENTIQSTSTTTSLIEAAKEVLTSSGSAATVIILEEDAEPEDSNFDDSATNQLLLAAPLMRDMLAEAEDSLFTAKWRATQGGERADVINRVVTRMHDFTTITAGQTKSFSAGRNDAWIVAVDADGTKLWDKKIGGARDDEANDIALLEDGGVVVVGGSESIEEQEISGSVGFIARISGDGQLLWSHFIKQNDAHPLTAQTLLSEEEGVAFGVASGTVNMYRFSLNGKRVSKQPVPGCVLNSVSAAVTTASGDIVIAGEHADFLDLEGSMCRLSSAGNTLWQAYSDTGMRSTISDIAAIGDDIIGVGFNLTEENNEQALAVRVEATGKKTWEKNLGTQFNERLLALNILSDNRILVLGSVVDPKTLASRHWIIALSESGEVVESQMGDESEELTLLDLAPRSDGRYVVVGRKTDEFSRQINGYIALMGVQNLSVGETIVVSEAAVAPNIIVPGDGSIISERPSTEILGNVIHNRPIARVFVDGQATRLLQNGAFRTFVSTPIGRTTVTIAAIDDLGHVGEAKVDVIRRESVEQKGEDLDEIIATTNFGSYHAILIGNQAYSNGIETLDTPYKDIEVLGALLKRQYGFQVTELKDATRKETLDALNNAVDTLGRNDNLMIYYAGHGHYDKDYDQGYWLPTDATIDDRTTWLESGAVKDMIKRMEAKHVLLVADSCFSGTLLRSVDNQRSSKFYEIIASRTARLAMTSGNIEPVMDGGGDGHSVFARQFISTLQKDRPIIDGTYLYNSVREPVVTQSGQMPQYSNIRFLESDGGDFLFVKHQ